MDFDQVSLSLSGVLEFTTSLIQEQPLKVPLGSTQGHGENAYRNCTLTQQNSSSESSLGAESFGIESSSSLSPESDIIIAYVTSLLNFLVTIPTEYLIPE